MKKNVYILPFLLVGLLPLCALLSASLFWQSFIALSVGYEIFYALLIAAQMFFVFYLGVLFKNKKAPTKAQMCYGALVAIGLIFVFFAGLFVFIRVLPVGSMFACMFSSIAACVYYFVFYVRTLIRFFNAYPVRNGVISAAISLVSTVAILLSFLLTPRFLNGDSEDDVVKGTPSTDTWAATDTYDIANTAVLEKDPSRDFVILNITDVQLCDYDFNPLLATYKSTFALIEEMVHQMNPDLITVSGDIGCGYEFATKQITAFLDSLEIPWAPVFGNHDHHPHTADSLRTADIFMEGKYCLFKKGDASLGVGNYIINVREGDRVVQSILMMDSHYEAEYEIDGKIKKGYAHFNKAQVDWYKWAIEGVQAYGNGETVESTVIAHIPVLAFAEAYEAYVDDPNTKDHKNGSWKVEGAFGTMTEKDVSAGLEDPYGFFDAIVEAGSTKNFVVGHDHKNNFSLVYKGVRLTYALNTGAGCYYSPRFNGGTTLTVDSSGNVTVVHHYFEK